MVTCVVYVKWNTRNPYSKYSFIFQSEYEFGVTFLLNIRSSLLKLFDGLKLHFPDLLHTGSHGHYSLTLTYFISSSVNVELDCNIKYFIKIFPLSYNPTEQARFRFQTMLQNTSQVKRRQRTASLDSAPFC